MWVPGQAHELALVHLGMDAGHADHRPAPHAPDPDLTISSPNSNSGRLYMVDGQAVHKPSNAREAEHQPGGGEGGGHQSLVLPHCVHHVLGTGDAEQVLEVLPVKDGELAASPISRPGQVPGDELPTTATGQDDPIPWPANTDPAVPTILPSPPVFLWHASCCALSSMLDHTLPVLSLLLLATPCTSPPQSSPPCLGSPPGCTHPHRATSYN